MSGRTAEISAEANRGVPSVRGALAASELRPWAGDHIPQQGSLPGEFRVLRQKILGVEIGAAGVAHARKKGHFPPHFSTPPLPLDGAARIVPLPVPILDAVDGRVAVPAESTRVG